MPRRQDVPHKRVRRLDLVVAEVVREALRPDPDVVGEPNTDLNRFAVVNCVTNRFSDPVRHIISDTIAQPDLDCLAVCKCHTNTISDADFQLDAVYKPVTDHYTNTDAVTDAIQQPVAVRVADPVQVADPESQ